MSTKEMIVKVGGSEYSLPNIALLLMMVAIVIPAVTYSIGLQNPTPSELLVAICIALFSSVVFLWILDATNVMSFRSVWVSRSVYGAAIASVLGTSVAVYKDYFEERKYPYEGKWELVIRDITNKNLSNFVVNEVALLYSEQSGYYWGYSDLALHKSNPTTHWVEVKEFLPKNGELILEAHLHNGEVNLLEANLTEERTNKYFRTSSLEGKKYSVTLSRGK